MLRLSIHGSGRLSLRGSGRLLLHPLAPDAGGDEFHSGGHQFLSRDDPDWKAIAAWIAQGKP